MVNAAMMKRLWSRGIERRAIAAQISDSSGGVAQRRNALRDSALGFTEMGEPRRVNEQLYLQGGATGSHRSNEDLRLFLV